MRLIRSTALAAILPMLLAASPVLAESSRDTVISEDGDVVVNRFGNCVRTKWMSEEDACAPEAPAPEPEIVEETPPPPPPKAPTRTLRKDELTIYFDFNSAELDERSEQKLNKLARLLKKDVSVTEAHIVGYADMIGSSDYNQRLSEKRAAVVTNFINDKGYLNTEVADIRALGEAGDREECNAMKKQEKINCLWQDRRVEIELKYYEDEMPAAE